MSSSCGEVEGMVRAFHIFSPSSHSNMGKFVDPDKAEIFGGISGFLEDAVTVCILLGQCQAQQAGGGVDLPAPGE